MGILSGLYKQEAGGVLIESSAGLATFLLMILGFMEFSRAIYADVYVGYAAHAATRYAMVRGSSWNGVACSNVQSANCTATASDVVSFVKGIAPVGIDTTSNLAVSPLWTGRSVSGSACVTTNGAASPGCAVQVQVTYIFHFAMPFVSKDQLRLTSMSVVTIAQ